MPLAKLSKKNNMSTTSFHQIPVSELSLNGMSMGGFGGGGGISGMGNAQHERERAELRAVIPTGRPVFDGIGVGGWEQDGIGDENENGFWNQRYERDIGGLAGGDNKPRKSV